MDIERLRTQRKQLAHRKRRIIYNNDGDDFLYGRREAKDTQTFLARRTLGVENTHVDTISYCTIQGFPHSLHRSKVCDLPDYDGTGAILAPHMWDDPGILIEGKDCLQIIIDFCRQHEIEVWCSVRMNDSHDEWWTKARTPWKGEHPERWLAPALDMGGGAEEKMFLVSEASLAHPERWRARGSCCRYYGANYSRKDVRDKMFEMIDEICQRYDLDGIELDLLRNPTVFSNTAQGEPDAGDENRALMTGLIRRIRQMTEDVGLRRGRPFVIVTRVPDDPDLAAAYGLEVRRWLKEELIDILIAGEKARIRPWKEFVEFGHDHGVPVYACAMEISTRDMKTIRGRALAAWAGGVDGIYTFNHFDPGSAAWKELGDPRELARHDRVTPVYNANVTHIKGSLKLLPQVHRFLKRPPRLPLELPSGKEQTFTFEAGENARQIAVSNTPHATLRMRFHFLEKQACITVSLNGHTPELLRDRPNPGWITCMNVAPLLHWGNNTLLLTAQQHDKSAEQPLRLINVELWVTTEPQVFDDQRKSDAQQSFASSMDGLPGSAFVLTEDALLPPCSPISGLQQWLVDELNFARPRVPSMFKMIRQQHDYPDDPIETPLPGWYSLAVLFDAEKMGDTCEKQMMQAFFRRVDASRLSDEASIHAGFMAGSHNLAALLVRSRLLQDLKNVANAFGPDCDVPGLLPLEVRFLRAEGDGHLIAGAFALVLRGIVRSGAFIQAKELWAPNRVSADDLSGTGWSVIDQSSPSYSDVEKLLKRKSR